MKKHRFLIFLLVILGGIVLFWFNRSRFQGSELVQECPDAWYENRQPTIGEPPLNSQYFVYDGDRVEVEAVDVAWVEQNCEINQPSIVY